MVSCSNSHLFNFMRWKTNSRLILSFGRSSSILGRSQIIPLYSSLSMQRCQIRGHSRSYDALLLDIGGTLLQPAFPVEKTYADYAAKYGCALNPGEVKKGFKRAFAAPWPEKLRYQGDGRPFWRHIVFEATGCVNDDYFEELYEHFAHGDAWRLATGASEVLNSLKNEGVKLAVVSNFDTRLRQILEELYVADLFDGIIVSAEIGYEKPDEHIFRAAIARLGVEAGRAVHVGDDIEADKMGANAVGMDCWLWGTDVKIFSEIYDRITDQRSV